MRSKFYLAACVFCLWVGLSALPQASAEPNIPSEIAGDEKIQNRLLFNEFFEKDLAQTEEQNKKKLLFNEYFERWLAKERKERQGIKRQIRLSHRTGYESNTSFDSGRKGSFFENESALLRLSQDHEKLGWFGKSFTEAYAVTNYQGYHDASPIDRYLNAGGFNARMALSETLALESGYELSHQRYIYNNPLTHLQHQISSGWVVDAPGPLVYRGFGVLRFKDYAERKILTASGAFGGEGREDKSLEAGLRFQTRLTALGLGEISASWLGNDSNDVYLDYNDYDSTRVNAYWYKELTPKIGWVGSGGFEYREYGDRVFLPDSTEPQRDNSFYLGSHGYFLIQEKTRAVLSYFYFQNDSSDSSQEYSSWTVTLGIEILV